ncbi:hypothetical protein [Pseudomonas sp. LD120]|uniref:hypothetical protein n=1 Tax=Pseudomonas sp. LD120 TaxID=485751 RepID=UPI002114F7B9|nr:hypothetical protein [Pseudomonas sp. LD120]
MSVRHVQHVPGGADAQAGVGQQVEQRRLWVDEGDGVVGGGAGERMENHGSDAP